MIRIFKLSIFCGKRDHFTGCAPSGPFPADRIFVRTKGIPGTSLQTGFPRVTARVEGTPIRVAGFTRYVAAKSGKTVAEVGASGYYNEDWGKRVDFRRKDSYFGVRRRRCVLPRGARFPRRVHADFPFRQRRMRLKRCS